jgi:hypothetical protein
LCGSLSPVTLRQTVRTLQAFLVLLFKEGDCNFQGVVSRPMMSSISINEVFPSSSSSSSSSNPAIINHGIESSDSSGMTTKATSDMSAKASASLAAKVPVNCTSVCMSDSSVSHQPREGQQKQQQQQQQSVQEPPIRCLAELETVLKRCGSNLDVSRIQGEGNGDDEEPSATASFDPELILRRCHEWLARLDARDNGNDNNNEEDKKTEWNQLLTRVLVSPRSLAISRKLPKLKVGNAAIQGQEKPLTIAPQEHRRQGELDDQDDRVASTQQRERQREQRLNDIQFQVLLRLVLWRVHGMAFVESYRSTRRQEQQEAHDATKAHKKKKHKREDPRNSRSGSSTKDQLEQDAQQCLLEDLRSILSMGSFTLSQHDSFVQFFTKCLPERFLHQPQLLPPSPFKGGRGGAMKNQNEQPQSVLLHLCDLFELANPYKEKKYGKDGNAINDEALMDYSWSSSSTSSKAVKKRKKASIGDASSSAPQAPPSKKRLSSVIGSKLRYRGGHFQNNLFSISKLLDRAQTPPPQGSSVSAVTNAKSVSSSTTSSSTTAGKNHVAPPPKTSLRIKNGLLDREGRPQHPHQQAQVKPAQSKNCLRPIRIHPIATTTAATTTVVTTSAQASPPHSRPAVDIDATPPRSNLRRRPIPGMRATTTNTEQSQWVVEETPAKPPRRNDTNVLSASSLHDGSDPLYSSKLKRGPETPLPPSGSDYQRTNRIARSTSVPETPLPASLSKETVTTTTAISATTVVTNSCGHKHRDDRHLYNNDEDAPVPETPARHPLSPIVTAGGNRFSIAETPMPATPLSEMATNKTMDNHHGQNLASFGFVAPATPDLAGADILKKNSKAKSTSRHNVVAQQLLFSPTPHHRRHSLGETGSGGGGKMWQKESLPKTHPTGQGNPGRRNTINKDLLFSPTPGGRRRRRHSISGSGRQPTPPLQPQLNAPKANAPPRAPQDAIDYLFSPKLRRRHSFAGPLSRPKQPLQSAVTTQNLLFSPTPRRLSKSHSTSTIWRPNEPQDQSMNLRL